MILILIGFVAASKCNRACPPFILKCTRNCANAPWVVQKRWVLEIIKDKDFRHKCVEYINSNVDENKDPDYPYGDFNVCPPWEPICPMSISDVPWYLQENWVSKLDSDESFVQLAIKNINSFSVKSGEEENDDSNTNKRGSANHFRKSKKKYIKSDKDDHFDKQRIEMNEDRRPLKLDCYSACPPWFEICTMNCMNEIWYKQKKWAKLIETDKHFREKALKYIPKLLNNNKNPEEQEIRFEKEIKVEQEQPDEKQIEEEFKDSNGSEESHSKNRAVLLENECHSSCPPWYEVCTADCQDRIWYQQEKWVELMEKDPEFKKKAQEYIPMPI